jgi:hypothetical protein
VNKASFLEKPRGIVCTSLVLYCILAAASPPVAAQSQSIVNRDVKDAEMLFFRGDYEQAVDRLREAKEGLREVHADNVKRGQAGVDMIYLESVIDILQGQIRAGQGFHLAAKDLLERASSKLQRRAAMLARRGQTVNDLALYNYQLGFIQLCLGDIALEEAVVDAIIRKKEPNRKRCVPFFEEGMKVIRNTFAQTDFREFDLQLRLLNYCDLRFAHMLVIDGDGRRARTYFDDARELLELDVYWVEQFNPEGTAKTFSNGVGGVSKAAPQAGGGAPGSPGPAPPTQGAAPNGANGSPPVEGSSVPPSTLVDIQSTSLDASVVDRHRIRTAIFYIQLLAVQAELEALNKQIFLAEEAASRARDIAEEQCRGTILHAKTLVNLSNIYCDCHSHERRLASDVAKSASDGTGSAGDVHALAAESYLKDAQEFIEAAGQIVDGVNPAQPINFEIVAVRRKIAELTNDGSALESLDIRCQELAEAKRRDKPSEGKP